VREHWGITRTESDPPSTEQTVNVSGGPFAASGDRLIPAVDTGADSLHRQAAVQFAHNREGSVKAAQGQRKATQAPSVTRQWPSTEGCPSTPSSPGWQLMSPNTLAATTREPMQTYQVCWRAPSRRNPTQVS